MYANKLKKLNEQDKFLKTQNLPRLNHKEIENLNRPIIDNEIELVILKLLTNKNFSLPGEFYQTLEEELILILHKIF